jgi:hypothetical protein
MVAKFISPARAMYPTLPSSADAKPAPAQAQAGGSTAARMYPKLQSPSRPPKSSNLRSALNLQRVDGVLRSLPLGARFTNSR